MASHVLLRRGRVLMAMATARRAPGTTATAAARLSPVMRLASGGGHDSAATAATPRSHEEQSEWVRKETGDVSQSSQNSIRRSR